MDSGDELSRVFDEAPYARLLGMPVVDLGPRRAKVTMVLRSWRLATIVLAALNMGMAWAHVLELPAKMRYDGPQWTRVQQTLYRSFGSEGPGA